MGRPDDIDHILRDWEYEPGEVIARLITADDGRDVLQVRIDLGILQLETEGRPDGTNPQGAETYYDYLLARTIHEGDSFILNDEEAEEVDREFVQYYQRRICWLALRRFDMAVRDADHNLALLDFVRKCAPSDIWYEAHEQYRPFILFHRTQAAALAALQDASAEQAIHEINAGLDRIRSSFDGESDEDLFEENEMILRLEQLRESLREEYEIGSTLQEQLDDAIENEQYELAAKIRDEIARREHAD